MANHGDGICGCLRPDPCPLFLGGMMKAKQTAFFCKECGYESAKWMGQCPGCRQWNTFVEEPTAGSFATTKSGGAKKQGLEASKPLRLEEISTDEEDRSSTGLHELDRVLGGGLVTGSLILVGGDPGIGKSTLLLQVCRNLADQVSVLYISGEESLKQIKMRASRIGTISGELLFLCETNLDTIEEAIRETKPEIVLHLAAQPIVRDSYKDPVYTYETNVIGTVNILECVRLNPCVKSFLNVTTDKVYENREWEYGYREVDRLDGYDPYSNSKSCSELVTHSYRKSFFADGHCAISTCRAGNVIGGGDFANDRIVPDCVRAAMAKKPIVVRNPHSTRPYQHVLEPLAAYLMVAKAQYEDRKYAGYYNVGPDDKDCVTTGELVDMFCNAWGNGLSWENKSDGGPHEANFLKLDCSKLKTTFGWHPRYGVKEAIGLTVEWCQEYEKNGDVVAVMDRQIAEMFQ